jgi:hypothetical protein
MRTAKPILNLTGAVALLFVLREDADALGKSLAATCKEHGHLFKWFRVKISPASAPHFVRMIPTKKLSDLALAIKASGFDFDAVHRAKRTQGAQPIARIKRAGVKHGRHGIRPKSQFQGKAVAA